MYFTDPEFFTPVWTGILSPIVSENMSPHVSWTLQSILAYLKEYVVCIVTSLPIILFLQLTFSSFWWPFQLLSILMCLARFKYLSIFFFLICFYVWTSNVVSMVRFYVKVPKNIMSLIFSDGFCFVHIPFASKQDSKSLLTGWRHRLLRHCSRCTAKRYISPIPLCHLSRHRA